MIYFTHFHTFRKALKNL